MMQNRENNDPGPTGLMRFDGEIRSAMLGSNWKYGPHAVATHLDYMVEFTVTVPILSLAGTMDNLPVGEQWLQKLKVD